MRLAEIQAQTPDPLTIDERFHIRSILGIADSVTDTYYDQAESKFIEINKRVIPDGIAANQETTNIYKCKELRNIYKVYDELEDGNLLIAGARDGVHISTNADRLRLALQLWTRIFPQSVPVPNEDVFTEMEFLKKQTLATNNGTFASVPVIFNELNAHRDEYSG